MIGEYLKTLRLERKLSQRALAEKSGVSNAEISRIESGERKKPSEEVLRALALVLKVDFTDILKNSCCLNLDPSFSKANLMDKTNFNVFKEQCEDKFISIITPKILKEGFNMRLSTKDYLSNITANRDDYIWRVKFIPIYKDFEPLDNLHLMEIYGRLACYNNFKISKFTIATNNEDAFKEFIKNNPVNLNILVSIMLVDLENNEIIDEYIFEKTPLVLDYHS
jgi:transcriptional regulator with XRE-family HTH domain